jgi:hypothetical protein
MDGHELSMHHLYGFLSNNNFLWHSKYATQDVIVDFASNEQVQAFAEIWCAYNPSQLFG